MCCSRALHPCEADKSYTVYRKPFPSRRASECDDQQTLHMLHSQAITISKLFPHITLSSHYHFQIIPSHYTLKPLPFPNYSLVYFFWGNCPITIYYLACHYLILTLLTRPIKTRFYISQSRDIWPMKKSVWRVCIFSNQDQQLHYYFHDVTRTSDFQVDLDINPPPPWDVSMNLHFLENLLIAENSRDLQKKNISVMHKLNFYY